MGGGYFNIAYLDADSGRCVFLGMDDDIDADWGEGVFTDNFIGEWFAIDNALLYIEVSESTDEYVLYTAPMLLNGEEYTLDAVYEYETGEYKILGARRAIDENGMAGKDLRKLVPGDVVEPIHIVCPDIENSGDFQEETFDQIVVGAGTSFGKVDLGDGVFLFMFEMWDYQGESYLSEMQTFLVEDGEISLE